MRPPLFLPARILTTVQLSAYADKGLWPRAYAHSMALLFRQTWTEPGSELVPSARHLVRAALDRFWTTAARERHDDVELVVAELLANAVVYAKPPIAIELTHEDHHLRLAVTDHSPDLLPPPPAHAALADTGRGLMLTSVLSNDWGWQVDQGSKTVWAQFTDN